MSSPTTTPPPPEANAEDLAIVGISPQKLACLLMGVILFGVVVSAAYIFTRRSVGPEVPAAVAAVQTAAPASPTAAKPAPLPAPVPPPPSAVSQPEPKPQTLAITAEETSGKTFLQVGAIQKSAVTRYVADLAAKGFAARAAEGPTPETARVLVGPLSGEGLKEMTARLTAAGVESFPGHINHCDPSCSAQAMHFWAILLPRLVPATLSNG